MNKTEQEFLNDLDKKLWTSADKLRSNVDAAVYKHVVLGLIFLKYVSDTFEERRQELKKKFTNKKDDYYIADASDEDIHQELEIRDYYLEENVFWVPALARWENLQNNAKLPTGTEIEIVNGKKTIYKFTSVAKLIDDALDAIEKENPKLKGVLNKTYTQLQIDPAKLAGVIDLIANIPFNHKTLKSKDILGHVYEYFLGQFALAEGKKGGQYFTPKAIVTLIVEMLEPYEGRVYDPAMGSGGFFVSSDRFLEEHADQKKYNAADQIKQISVYGQESNPTTWKLAAMNMAIRGIDFNFGKGPHDTFSNDQHPDLRADFVMANPPFNMKEWNSGVKEDDPRWKYGTPPANNANFAWMQHMLHHLSTKGRMGLLLANGSMSSNTNNEGTIRKGLIDDNKIDCMVALPGQLFTNTQIPACIWFLAKTKKKKEILFIDARNMGYMKDRVLRDFANEDIRKIADTYHAWQKDKGYEDKAGFCFSADLEKVKSHDYVLTPGRYVGAAEEEQDREPFADKMARLTDQLKRQFEESHRLEGEIRTNLETLGYEV